MRTGTLLRSIVIILIRFGNRCVAHDLSHAHVVSEKAKKVGENWMSARKCWLLVLTLVFTFFTVGSAKEFTFPMVRIDARINPDGSIHVTEARTYRFSGDFSWASMWLPTVGSQSIRDVTISEGGVHYTKDGTELPGTYQVNSTSSRTDIKWFYRAENEERTFIISYVVQNAVTVYQDVAELYWQFIGPGWDVATKRAEVWVTLPQAASPEEVRVWGHGPLQGNVRVVDDKTALWEIDHLPSHTFLEARMTFPTEFVPAAARRVAAEGLPTILAEEQEWADAANLARARSKRDVWGFFVVIPLTVLGGILFWWKVGRPYRGTFTGDYYREPPRDHEPAVLGILWRGSQSAQDIAATMLDLVRKRIIEVESLPNTKRWQRKNDFVIRRHPDATTEDFTSLNRTPNELLVIELLFNTIQNQLPADEPVTLSANTRYSRRHASRFAEWHQRWNKAALKSAKPHIAMDKTNRGGRILGGVIAVGLIGLGILWMSLDYVFTGMAVFGSAFTLLILVGVSGRRTPEAQTEYNQWKAFRRYLKEFSNLKEAPVYSVAIWEHYLVYATVLGVAKEVAAQLEALAPQFAHDPNYSRSFLFLQVHSPGISQSFSNSLTNAFVTTIQAATSHASSGSGHGGGFSSGGGGGGGGGGGSAG